MRDVVTASVALRPKGTKVIFLRIGADLVGRIGAAGLRSLRVELKASRGIVRLSPGTGWAASWMVNDTGHQVVVTLGLASLGYDVPLHDSAHCQWALDEQHRLVVTLPSWACPPANTGGQRAVEWVEIVPVSRGGRRAKPETTPEPRPSPSTTVEQPTPPTEATPATAPTRPAAKPAPTVVQQAPAPTAVAPAITAPPPMPTCPLLGALLGQVMQSITERVPAPAPAAAPSHQVRDQAEDDVLEAAVRLVRTPGTDTVKWFSAYADFFAAARALVAQRAANGKAAA